MRVVQTNVNQHIMVKLTPKGIEHWMEDVNSNLPTHLKLTPDIVKNKMDDKGFHTFQIWEFMEIFGAKSGMGMPTLFETEVLIETSVQ